MFKIGISSKVLRDYPLVEAIEMAEEIGYQAFELWVDDLLTCPYTIQELKGYLQSKNLTYSIHLQTEDLNIASFNEGIRQESIRQQSEGIKLAAKLGIDQVTLHPGRKVAKSKTIEESWHIQLEAIETLVQVAEAQKVMLCVENMEKIFGEYIFTQSDIERIRQAITSPYLGFTLDVAHLQTLGQAEEMVREITYPIHHVHISQATTEKMHLPITQEIAGGIDYTVVFAHLQKEFKGSVILEGYVRGEGEKIARESYNWIMQRIERLGKEK